MTPALIELELEHIAIDRKESGDDSEVYHDSEFDDYENAVDDEYYDEPTEAIQRAKQNEIDDWEDV